MSTFKKVLCFVLCVAILAGTVAILNFDLPRASAVAPASVGTSNIKTIAELEALYDGYIYLASDILEYEDEADRTSEYISDGYVESGDLLSIRMYLKSDLYLGSMTLNCAVTNTMFDVKNVNGANNAWLVSNSSNTGNPDHFCNSERQMNYKLTTKDATTYSGGAYFKTITGFPAIDPDLVATWDLFIIVITYGTASPPTYDSSLQPSYTEIWNDDDYFYQIDVRVKEGLADGTTGTIGSDERIWKAYAYDGGTTKVSPRPGSIPFNETAGEAGVCKNMVLLDDFILEDFNHTLTVGANPNAGGGGGGGTAVGTSNIKTIAELEASYDGYIYLASDILEYEDEADRTTEYISDGYVESGDLLSIRMYLKSDLYLGSMTLNCAVTNTMFDVKNVNGANNAWLISDASNTGNPAHFCNSERQMNYKLTTKDATTYSGGAYFKTITGFPAIDPDLVATWDLFIIVITYGTASPPTYDSSLQPSYTEVWNDDDYFYQIDVRVKEGLADGTTGTIGSDERIWKAYAYDGGTTKVSPRPGSIPFNETAGEAGVCKNMVLLDDFILEDFNHTLTVGANPNAGGGGSADTVIVKYDLSSLSGYAPLQGVEVEDVVQNKGEQIAIPTELSSLTGLIGWALADGTFIDVNTYELGYSDITLIPVIAGENDTVNVTFNAGTGKFGTEADSPSSKVTTATFTNNSGVISATIILPDSDPIKTGSTFNGWFSGSTPIPATLTAKKNVAFSAKWTARSYTFNFFVSEEDYNANNIYSTLSFNYDANTFTVPNASVPANSGFAIASWVNAANDTSIATTSNLNGIIFVKSEIQAQLDMLDDDESVLNIYTTWESQSTVIFMGKNYASTGPDDKWIEITTKSGVPGDSTNIADIYNSIKNNPEKLNSTVPFNALLNPEWYYDADFTDLICAANISSASINYPTTSATQVVYLKTILNHYNSTWYVPAYDAATNTYDIDNIATYVQVDYVEAVGPLNAYEGSGYRVFNPSFERIADNASNGRNYPTLAQGWVLLGWSKTPGGDEFVENYTVAAEKVGLTASDFKLEGGINSYYAILAPETYIVQLRPTDSELFTVTAKTRGDTITFDEVPVKVYDDGVTTLSIPAVGSEGSSFHKGGYTFLGWHLSRNPAAEALPLDLPITLDGNIISNAYYSSASAFKLGQPKLLNLYGSWQAKNLDMTFVYKDFNGDEKTATVNVTVGSNYKTVLATQLPDLLDETKFPHGFTIQTDWVFTEGKHDAVTNDLLDAGTYTAVYVPSPIVVTYLYDSVENTQNKMSDRSRYFGEDASDVLSAERTSFGYYKWPKGYIFNEWVLEEGALAEDGTFKENLVYRATFTPRKEFFLRVYDTNGFAASIHDGTRSDENIYMTIHNGKIQYWNECNKVDKSEANLNPNEEMTIVFFLKFHLENFDADFLFDPEMWAEVSLYAEPFTLPRALFTAEGIKGLFSMIGNLIFGDHDETTTVITNPPEGSTTPTTAPPTTAPTTEPSSEPSSESST